MTIEQMLQILCNKNNCFFQLSSLKSGWIELFDVTSLKRVTAPNLDGAVKAMYKNFYGD